MMKLLIFILFIQSCYSETFFVEDDNGLITYTGTANQTTNTDFYYETKVLSPNDFYYIRIKKSCCQRPIKYFDTAKKFTSKDKDGQAFRFSFEPGQPQSYMQAIYVHLDNAYQRFEIQGDYLSNDRALYIQMGCFKGISECTST